MTNRNDIQERVIKIVSQTLKIEPSKIKPESNFIFDFGADSMVSLGLVSGLETEFDMDMDEETVLKVQTVDKTVDYIIGHLEKNK